MVTTVRSAMKNVRAAVRRVLVLAVLWGLVRHQVGIVGAGVLDEPTFRVVAALGAAVEDVVVAAAYAAPKGDDAGATLADVKRAAAAALSELRQQRPDVLWVVEETRGPGTLHIAIVGELDPSVDGAGLATIRRDVARVFARHLHAPPSAVATEVVIVAHVGASAQEETALALTRVGARPSRADDSTLWRVGAVQVLLSAADARTDIVAATAAGSMETGNVSVVRYFGGPVTMTTTAHMKR